MSLFEVEGWTLPKKIRTGGPGGPGNAKKADKKTKEKKAKKFRSDELQGLYDEHVEGKKRPAPSKESEEEAPAPVKKQKKKSKDHVTKTEPTPTVVVAEPEAPKVDAKPAQKLTPLQQKMKEKLTGARFRWINEQMYTSTSTDAFNLIQETPEMFDEYHEGFRSQVKAWPENPVDTFIGQFKQRLEKPINAPGGLPGSSDGTVVVADMGCGEAQLAHDLMQVKGSRKTKKLKFKIHSFDLKKANERITVADIKNVPLPDQSVDVVVFCLALMGTNFLDFVREGLRILKPRGEMWIAEIKSRFVESDTTKFVDVLKSAGLFHKSTDDSNKMFIRFEFFKPPKDILEQRQRKQETRKPKFIDQQKDPKESGPEGTWLLKPCLYKRR